MSKKRTSLAELELPDLAAKGKNNETETRKARKEQGNEPEKKIIKQTLYLPEAVHEQLRVLAFHERVKQHDLLMEGLDMLFKSRGAKSLSELATGTDVS